MSARSHDRPYPLDVGVIVLTVIAVACTGAAASQSPQATPTVVPPTAATASGSAAPPSAAAATVVDLFHEQVSDPEARWVADIEGWFITAVNPERNSVNLYPVSGVLFFSVEDHLLVVTMPEPAGIRVFEQAGGASSLLDAIRASNLEVVGPEAVDGRELTLLRAGAPVEMAAFGDVSGAPGPTTGSLEILVDEAGAPVRMRLTSVGVDGDPTPEMLTFDVFPGDRGQPVPQGITWTPFESSRFGYAIEVPADFEQVADEQFDIIKDQGYGGWDIRRDDLDGDSPANFMAGYIDFLATGAEAYGQPTNLEEYLTVGANDEAHGTLATFHYPKDGVQRVAFVALIATGDHVWEVTWRGLAEHEIADRTMLLQMLASWRTSSD